MSDIGAKSEDTSKQNYDIPADPRYDYNRDSRYDYNRDSRHDYNRDSRHDSNRDSRYDYNRDSRYDSNRDSRYDSNRDSRYDSNRDSRYDCKQDPRYSGASYNRRKRMRELALTPGNKESLQGLEQIFEAKLAAIRGYEQSLNAVADPYARKTIQQMIRNERRDLVNLTDLADLTEQSPDLGSFTRTKRQLRHEVRMRTGQDITFWLGAAAVGAVLLPSVREKLRPLAVKAVQGVRGLTDQAQGIFSGGREDIEDLVSEAQFERFKDSLDPAATEAESLQPDNV